MATTQQQPSDQNTLAYRVTSLERDVVELRDQLNRYVPVRENELQLKSMRDTTERIEHEVQEARKQLEGMNTKLILQDQEAQKRDAAQREGQAALQIKVLWGTVSTVIAVLTSVLIGYVTRLFH